MKFPLTQLLIACFALATAVAQPSAPALIPQPAEVTPQAGVFQLGASAAIACPGLKSTGEFLAARLRRGTGFKIPVSGPLKTDQGSILLEKTGPNPDLGNEGYELTVTPTSVVILAPTETGVFYGVQTLLQLLPPEILAATPAPGVAWTIPCVHIKDKPRFAWRGLMLDVSRHFYTTGEVETILDTMALYKLNTFHFHLVDDPGWRIEIKKYPLLTKVGAWRNGIDYELDPKASTAYRADGKYGGFYTQKDIRELVRYAAARHITIVPEIEMPGHSAGALASYPEYSCTGGPFSLDGDDAIFCPGNEKTFTFLENILTEVFKLFPGQFVHVGGDEVSTKYWKNCPKCQARMKTEGLTDERQLEAYLMRRIDKFVSAHGKRLIGWSEIGQDGLAKNAAVMDWIGGASVAARAGHDVVMSPTGFCYLDYYQSRDHKTEPRAIGGFLPLQHVYEFEPIPGKLDPKFQAHILGGQGNLWTEFVPNLRHAEFMIFPRECAMAEVLWSPKNSRNWDDFLSRTKTNERRLDALGVNYRHDPTNTGH